MKTINIKTTTMASVKLVASTSKWLSTEWYNYTIRELFARMLFLYC